MKRTLSLAFAVCLVLGLAAVADAQQEQMNQQNKSDRQLADVVSNRLARSATLAGTQIAVSVDDHVATLEGTVGSDDEKQRAERIARRTSGVYEVDNNLEVDPAELREWRDVEVDDETMARKIANKLVSQAFPTADAEENWLYGWQVDGAYWEFDVDYDDGDVALEGEVPTYQDVTQAIQVVRQVPGVRTVDAGDLEVDNWNMFWDYDPYYYRPYYDAWDYDYEYYDDLDWDWDWY